MENEQHQSPESISQNNVRTIREKALKVLFFSTSKQPTQHARHFKLWLWFRKNIVESTIEQYRTDRNYFLEKYITAGGKFPREKSNNSRTNPTPNVRKIIESFWDICFADNLPYKVIKSTNENIGFTIISQTENITEIVERLNGWYYPLRPIQAIQLKAIGYPSLIDDGSGEVNILYGPIEFLNHHCNAIFGFSERKFIRKVKITRQKEYDLPGQEIFVRKEIINPLVKNGEELFVKYNKNNKDLWFNCQNSCCLDPYGDYFFENEEDNNNSYFEYEKQDMETESEYWESDLEDGENNAVLGANRMRTRSTNKSLAAKRRKFYQDHCI